MGGREDLGGTIIKRICEGIGKFLCLLGCHEYVYGCWRDEGIILQEYHARGCLKCERVWRYVYEEGLERRENWVEVMRPDQFWGKNLRSS